MLRLERAQTHRQLMGVVLMLTGFLTHPVEALAQAVALSQEQFTLFGVDGHAIQRVLQLQAGLAELFVFDGTLLAQFAQFFVQTRAAQGQLFDLGLASRQLRLEFALLTRFILQTPTQLLTGVFLLQLLLAQGDKLLLKGAQGGFALLTLQPQALQLLTASEYPAFCLTGAAHP